MCVRLEEGRRPPWHFGADAAGEEKDRSQVRRGRWHHLGPEEGLETLQAHTSLMHTWVFLTRTQSKHSILLAHENIVFAGQALYSARGKAWGGQEREEIAWRRQVPWSRALQSRAHKAN